MKFSSAKFSQLLKEKSITSLELLHIMQDKYDIDMTLDAIKSYRRKAGKNATPSLDKLTAFAKILGVTVDDLLLTSPTITKIKSVPVVSSASCGLPLSNAYDELNKSINISADDWNSELYAVVACGDSMASEIYDGDVCVIDPNAPIQNGDMVLYKLDNEMAIKVYIRDEDAYLIQFIPFNTNEIFKTKNIRLDDDVAMEKLTVHKVVQVVSSKKNNRSARLKMLGR